MTAIWAAFLAHVTRRSYDSTLISLEKLVTESLNTHENQLESLLRRRGIGEAVLPRTVINVLGEHGLVKMSVRRLQ